MSDHLDLRTAFYPCCGTDIIVPLRILRDFVDRVIFCDSTVSVAEQYEKTAAKANPKWPATRLITGPAQEAVKRLQRIDVLFYRCDGVGEGGSGVKVLGNNFLPLVLEHMPISGGLIITDGSNTYPKSFEKMIRPRGVMKFGWHLHPHPTHPIICPPDGRSYCHDGKLHVIQVTPVIVGTKDFIPNTTSF